MKIVFHSRTKVVFYFTHRKEYTAGRLSGEEIDYNERAAPVKFPHTEH